MVSPCALDFLRPWVLFQDYCPCLLSDFYLRQKCTISIADELVIVLTDLGCVLIINWWNIVHDPNVKGVPEESISLNYRQCILFKMFQEILCQYSWKQSLVSLDLFILLLSEILYLASLSILVNNYILHFEFTFLLVHLSYFLPFSFFLKLKFLLTIFHYTQFLFLQYLHSAHFKDSSTQYVKEWLNFVVEIEKFIVPNLCFSLKLDKLLHIDDIVALRDSVSQNRFFWQSISLWGVLIPWRFVGKCFDKLICEYFDIGSLVSFIKNDRFLLGLEITPGILNLLSVLDIFQCNKGSMGIASEDSLVPHEIVIDEFSG